MTSKNKTSMTMTSARRAARKTSVMAGVLVLSLGLPFAAYAQAEAQTQSSGTEGNPAPGGSTTHFELHDHEDSPPVNYRSNEDPRYDTQEQRDAEMYAEQYEKQRAQEDLKQQQFLDKLNKTSRSPGVGAKPGTIETGFPAR